MYSTSVDFLPISKSLTSDARCSLSIGDADVGGITDITLQSSLGDAGSLTVGAFVSQSLSITCLSSALPNVISAQPIEVGLGYMVDGSPELCPMGVFYTEPRYISHKNNLTVIQAYDRAWTLNDEYTSSLTYPVFASAVMSEIATAAVITVTQDAAYSRLSNKVIYSAPQGSYREVIAHLALLIGCNVRFGRTGELEFIPVNLAASPVASYTGAHYRNESYTLTSDEEALFGVVTCNYTHDVTTGSGETQDTEEVTETWTYTASAGSRGVTINTTDVRSQAETSALGAFIVGSSGVGYYGYTVTLLGQPQLDLGDNVTVVDPNGDSYTFAVMSVTHNFTGAMSTTISATIADGDTELDAEGLSGSLTDAVAFVNNALGRQTRLLADTIAANNAQFNTIEANKADIDFANVNTATISDAWIKDLMVQGDMIAQSGTVYYLDAVQVNASNITAGTIDVERLIITVNNEKYLVHVNPSTGVPVYEKLDGNVIEDLTITADKIVAGAITADKITTSNIVGSGGWINLRSGTFNYTNSTTGQGISWNGSQLLINGSVTIGGTVQPLSDTLEGLTEAVDNTLIYDTTYEYNVDGTGKKISASFTAYLYRAGVDVKTEFDSSDFTWYLKKEDTDGQTKEIYLGSGYTMTVSLANCGFGAEVVGKFTPTEDSPLLSSNDDSLTDSENDPLTARTATGDSVRVRDLTVSTTLYPTDKLMVVGAEDEHLVSMQTLQNYLNANLDKQILFGTTAEWNAQSQLQSVANTIYVYKDHKRDSQNRVIAGIKVGDGNAYLIDLPFTDEVEMGHISDTDIHITAAERLAWNNKVSCYYSSAETLVFTTA